MATLIHKVGHGLLDDDPIMFGNLVGGEGLEDNTVYYVRDATADDFAVALTVGGAAIEYTTDITGGDVVEPNTYQETTDPAMAPPDPVATPTAPTVTSALVSGIVRLRVVLNDIAEPKVREWEVQVTHKYDSNGDPDWSTPFSAPIPAGVAGGEEVSIPALGNTNYTVRVRAQDVYGQFGSFSTEVDITTIEGSDSLSAALAAIANGVDGQVIGETNILPDSITTPMLRSGAVTADILAATIVLSSLLATGVEGERRVEMDTEGIRLIDADESLVVNIPTDSTKPVYFRGEVVAESFNSQNENDLSGSIGVTGDAVMTLANGVSAPSVSPTVTAFLEQRAVTAGVGSLATRGMSYDANGGTPAFWVPADPASGYVAHQYRLSDGVLLQSIEATGSSTTTTTTYGNTSHIADTAEATDSASETQIATPIVMPRDGRITKVSIYLAGHNDSPTVRNCVWSNGGTLIDNSASYTAANEGATGVGDSHQYNKALANGTINYIGGTTYKVGAMLTSDGFVGWQWDRDDGSGKTTYLGSGENFDPFVVTRTETTHKPNVYITYEYDTDTRLETAPMIAVATDGTYVYTLDNTGVVWKYQRSDWTHVSHSSSLAASITGTDANAGMFWDDTAGRLIITTFAGVSGTDQIKFVLVNPNNGGITAPTLDTTITGSGQAFNGLNDYALGGQRVDDGGTDRYWVPVYQPGTAVAQVHAFNLSTGAYISDRAFGQNSSVGYGVFHDGTQFWGRSTSTLFKFTSWDWTTDSAIYWFAYAWYDSAGTTHETAISPRTSLTLRRRENVRVSQGAIPTGGADDPDKVRIYFKPNATDPGAGALKLQVTDALTSRDFATYNSGGAADGGGTPFATGSPATIASAGTGWTLKGSGFINRTGTSFPASPATGDTYWRSDLNMEFFYDGTRWLSTTLFETIIEKAASSTTSISASTNWNERISRPLLRGGSDIYMVQLEVMFFVNSGGTALGASHKWVGTFHKADSANSLTTLITVNINSGASSTWRTDLQSINALLGSFYELGMDWTKTGTPGSLVPHTRMTYRIVAT